MKHRSIIALLGIGTVVLSACSAIGLQDFVVPPCQADSDCDALNEAEGIDHANPATCELYQCVETDGSPVEGQCILRTRDDDEDRHPSLRCGGDDCDDADGSAYPGAPYTSTLVVEEVADPRWLRWGASPTNRLVAGYALPGAGQGGLDILATPAGPEVPPRAPRMVAHATDATANLNFRDRPIMLGCPTLTLSTVPPSTSPVVPTPPADKCQTHAECQDDLYCNGLETCDPGSPLADEVTGCRAATNDPCGADACDETIDACLGTATATCTVADLAAAHLRDDEWLTASINTNGCQVGLVLVGWTSTGTLDVENGVPGPNLLLRDGVNRAPGYAGVGIGGGANGRCSGGNRIDGAPVGAASLSAAAIPPSGARRRPQGLVAYLAAPLCRSRGDCAAEVVGRSGPVSVELIGAWLEQAEISSGVPARWVSLSDAGYPRSLETQTNGSAPPALAGVDAGYVLAYGAAGGGLVARFIPALPDPSEVLAAAPYPTTQASLGPAGEVRDTPTLDMLGADIALPGGGGASSEVDDVAVAAGAPSGDRVPLLFTWVEVGAEIWSMTATLDTAAGTIDADAPVLLSSDGASPEVTYASSGVCGPDCGGWAVTWIEGGTARLVRYDDDGAAIDAEPVTLGPATFARAFATGGAIRVAAHDPTQDGLVVSNGQCGQ